MAHPSPGFAARCHRRHREARTRRQCRWQGRHGGSRHLSRGDCSCGACRALTWIAQLHSLPKPRVLGVSATWPGIAHRGVSVPDTA
eukprot:2586294-Rhodomonas_salina.2